MLVTVTRSQTGSTLATISRQDGVIVELPGYDKKYRVPHDLAHLATERHLLLSGGVFGTIAGGGMFANMRVIEGRPRPDAAARSRRILAENKRSIGLAEIMAGVVHAAVERGAERQVHLEARKTWASQQTGSFPWTDQQVTDSVAYLTKLAASYDRDGVVQVEWPDRLSSPTPPGAGLKHGRRSGLPA